MLSNESACHKLSSLSLHDALPISKALLSAVPSSDPDEKKERIILKGDVPSPENPPKGCAFHTRCPMAMEDRKSTRLNSSHVAISYAVFCLKKKKLITNITVKLQTF